MRYAAQAGKTRPTNIAGPVIRRLRVARGWTQADLAAKLQLFGLELERSDVAKLESQLRSIFDFELFILSAVLEVSPADLNPGLKKTKFELPMLRMGYKDTLEPRGR